MNTYQEAATNSPPTPNGHRLSAIRVRADIPNITTSRTGRAGSSETALGT